MLNIYHTLFNDLNNDHSTNDDIAMEIINQMYGNLDFNTLSKYYDLSSYNDLITTQNSTQITVMHINSRSLSKNSDNIKSFLRSLSTPPNVLAATETWLTDSNKHLHEIAGFHSYHLVRNARARGGVTVYVTNLLNSE